MKHWIWGLGAVALTACSGGGGGDDGGSSSASNTPPPVPEYVAYDTGALDTINAPAPAEEAPVPALSDPDTIAIIDTAFNLEHSAYADQVIDYYDAIVGLGAPYTDQDAVPGFRNHGTAVASIAAGHGLGVSPNSGLMLVRAAEANDANTEKSLPLSAIAEGMEYLLGRGADVLNLSMSLSVDPYWPESIAGRVHTALKTGIAEDDWVVVVSAGNDDDGVVGFQALADHADYQGQALVVGALASTEPQPYMASFSNNAIDRYMPERVIQHFIVAPGVLVCAGRDLEQLYNDYVPGCNWPTMRQIEAGMPSTDINDALAAFTGTSAAAPVVSGAVARIRRAHPELDGAAIVQLLMETATDFGEPGYDPIYGAGLINLEAALAAAPTFEFTPIEPAPEPDVAILAQRSQAARKVPENAIQTGDDLYMVPSAPAPNGCMMFTTWSQSRATDTAIYWRNARGEFSTSPAGCLVVKDGAHA